MKINITTEIDTEICDACVLGELLRDYLFVNDGNEALYTGDKNYKQTGCYETFDVRKDAVEFTQSAIESLLKKYDLYDSVYSEDDNLTPHGYSFYYFGITIFCIWFWDGDGTLIFDLPDRRIINTDCKNSSYWEELEKEKKMIGVYLFCVAIILLCFCFGNDEDNFTPI